MVRKPAHRSESLIDCVYIKKTLMEKLTTNVSVENIYFSDHDTLRIATEEKSVHFQKTS